MELTRTAIQDYAFKGATQINPRIPTIEQAFRLAEKQLEKGDTIGERKTPVISFWPITLKRGWANYGSWWTTIAPDGDMKFVQGVGPVEPIMMQLFYVREGDQVTQLAWERPDVDFRASRDIICERATIEV